MPLPLPTSSSTCPRCAIDATLPGYGGIHHFWNVCDSCRSNNFVHDPQQQDGRDEQMAGMAAYSKEDDELSALFASADFSLTHRPHLWEPGNRPPAYALVEGSASLRSQPMNDVSRELATPRQDPTLQDSRQQHNDQHHAFYHPPLGIADRRLQEDSTMARTQSMRQQQQHLVSQQQGQEMAAQHQPQIYYASAHYNHSAHVVARQVQIHQQQQQPKQQQGQQHQNAEPYMHDGYAHMQSGGGLWTLPSDHALPGTVAIGSKHDFREDDVDMGD